MLLSYYQEWACAKDLLNWFKPIKHQDISYDTFREWMYLLIIKINYYSWPSTFGHKMLYFLQYGTLEVLILNWTISCSNIVWKVSVFWVFLFCIFPHSVWILPVYSLCIQSECGKLRSRKTPNTDTFHAA